MLRAGLTFLMLATAAAAQDGWVPLTGSVAQKVLSDRVLAYPDGAKQKFALNGETVYKKNHPQPGNWKIDGDKYCSLWPPSDTWTCYRLEANAAGTVIRFIADDGSVTEGRIAD